MDTALHDRVAVVTGAAAGIGLAHCRALAAEGARLAMVDLDNAALQSAARTLREEGIDALPLAGDACDPEAVRHARDRTVAHFGRLDVLVNNAGIGMKPPYRVADMPVAAWDAMIAAHARSTFLWSQAVLPPMTQGGFGRIVNTSSMHFTGGGRAGAAHYAAAKGAVAGFTQTLAREVGGQGITVNAIAPGYVSTGMIDAFSDDMMARIRHQNPKGRLCEPHEVAALVVFLCSAHADFINGEILCIDGGRRDFVWN